LEKLVAEYTPDGASEDEIREMKAMAKAAAGQPLSDEETKILLTAAARDLADKYTPRTAAKELEKLATEYLPPGTSEETRRELAAAARHEAGFPISEEDTQVLLAAAARDLAEKYTPRTAAKELEKLAAQYLPADASEETKKERMAAAKHAAGQPLSEEETQVLLAAKARELTAKYSPRTAAQELEKLASEHGADPGVVSDMMAAATASAKLAAGEPLSEAEAKALLATKAKELAAQYTPRTAAKELEKLAADYLPPGTSQDSILELTAQAKYSAGVPLSQQDAQALLNVAAREMHQKYSPRTVNRKLEDLAEQYMAGADPDDVIEFAEKAMKNAKGGDTRAQVALFARGIAHKAMMGSEDMVVQRVQRNASPSSRSPSPEKGHSHSMDATIPNSTPAPFPIQSMPPAGRGRSPMGR
jgi:hypothetical protein